jgi:hypothetical protein
VVFSGNTSSCGCLRRETTAKKNHRHGMRKRSGDGVPEYSIWKGMRQRCNDPNNHEWNRYGGRGIRISARWDEFLVFLADVGARPTSRHSLDRIDNDGDYEPGNVRWATLSEQANNKRSTKRFDWEGERLTVGELSTRSAIRYGLLAWRIHKGWSLRRAMTEPIRIGKNQYASGNREDESSGR